MQKRIIFTDRSDTLLDRYLKDIYKYKLLPQDEINKLIDRAKTGDLNARDAVVKANLRFVVTIAKQFQNRGIPLIDLINEGNQGLLMSIPKFDTTRGVTFLSYAVYWIKQYIFLCIYNNSKEIRLPTCQYAELRKLLNASSEFIKEHAREPSSEELSEITGISCEHIDFMAQYKNRTVSLDEPAGREDDSITTEETIANNDRTIEEDLNEESLKIEMERLVSKLPNKEQDVIRMMFGIGMKKVPYETICMMFGVERERIRQIKEAGLERLRKKSNILKQFY